MSRHDMHLLVMKARKIMMASHLRKVMREPRLHEQLVQTLGAFGDIDRETTNGNAWFKSN